MQKQIEASEKNLKILVPYKDGVSFDKAFQLAKEKKKIIISNKLADKVLAETDIWKKYNIVFPIWTGTMTAYVEPNRRLGSAVEYEDPDSKLIWTFPVPIGFVGLKNTILAVEYPDYDLIKDGNRIVIRAGENKIIPVENFPKESGWYKRSDITRIPINIKIDLESSEIRYLYRTQKAVGPLARCDRRSIYANGRPSDGLGVLVVNRE